MIDRNHQLSISRQAELLEISRGSIYCQPRPVSKEDLTLMRKIDELHLEHPFMGVRMPRDQLNRMNFKVGRKRVSTLMKEMGIESCSRNPKPARSTRTMQFTLTCCAVK